MTAPEPPPADTSWIQMTSSRARPSGYVHRPSRTARHTCPLPAEWEPGAVWRCPEGHLWVVEDACEACRTARTAAARGHGGQCTVGLAWWPASWWKRRKYGGKRVKVDMANGNRVQSFAGLALPPPAPLTPPKDFDG